MTIDCSEFERLTGVFLSAQMLETVERVYLWEYRMTGWKDFCEKYKRNEDDIAERIAIMATLDQNERVQQLDYKIKKLKRIEKVAGQFEKAYQQYLDVKNQDEL